MKRRHDIESSGDDINLFSLDMYMMLSAMGITLGIVFIVLKIFLPDFFSESGNNPRQAPKTVTISKIQWDRLCNDCLIKENIRSTVYQEKLFSEHPDTTKIYDIKFYSISDKEINWYQQNPHTIGTIIINLKFIYDQKLNNHYLTIDFPYHSRDIKNEMVVLKKWNYLYLLSKAKR